jgi:hypothetical protein
MKLEELLVHIEFLRLMSPYMTSSDASAFRNICDHIAEGTPLLPDEEDKLKSLSVRFDPVR